MDEVDRDFCDLFPLADGRWAFFLGDACGKGAEAAALTSLTRYTLRAGGTNEPVPVIGGQLIGLLPELRFTQTSTRLGPGDALPLYTDGLTEARTPSGSMLEEEGLAAHLAAGTWHDADDLLAGIRRLFDHLGTDVNDDAALLALSVPIHRTTPAQETR